MKEGETSLLIEGAAFLVVAVLLLCMVSSRYDVSEWLPWRQRRAQRAATPQRLD
jgi:hypothetical protein